MTLEKIKREFVRHMETIRATDPYPRNFMGCLISIIIEPEPIGQERIVELTGYSQSTVSLTLHKLQYLMPIRTIRKRGDRKHYYFYDGSPERFVLDLWQKRVEAQAISFQMIEPMITLVSDKADRCAAFRRFADYLENLKLYLRLVDEVRNRGIEEFRNVLDKGLKQQDMMDMKSQELTDFLDSLRNISYEPTDHTSKTYLQFKNEYFTSVKTNLNPLFSQAVANQMIVIHSVFLEGRITQEQLESSTLLPRSTISEVLTNSVKIGIIKFSKREGSRIKLYQPAISFADFILGNYDLVDRQITEFLPQLLEYIKRTRKIRPMSKKAKQFLNILNNLKKAYSFTQQFSRRMKVEMILKLKEEYDRGFVFI